MDADLELAPQRLGAPWSCTAAADLYGVDAWGGGYFVVDPGGHLAVRPGRQTGATIDLLKVVEGLRRRGLEPPFLIRFPDLLRRRLEELWTAFRAAMDERAYEGSYRALYPVKVNQQRQVVEEIYRQGAPFGFGLEVGSKPELLAVMPLAAGDDERPIVCNGFKDARYIETAVLATKLGRRVFIIVERLSELEPILRASARHDVRPRLGVRLKLSRPGAGRWHGSAGARSKFGLSASEILEVLARLGERGMHDCLRMVHCHLGSQVNDIRSFKEAVSEVSHVYVELARLGARLGTLDVGGGLGVDYDGSQSAVDSSMNYTLEEFASDIVHRVAGTCDLAGVPHPDLVTECGRAMVAHHSVLVIEVLGAAGLDGSGTDPGTPRAAELEKLPQPVQDLHLAWSEVSAGSLLECYHDVLQARDESLHLFNLGYLDLETRGVAERLFWATLAKIRDLSERLEEVPEELADLGERMSDTYYCNFSVFQSLPDSWAIGQLFPVVPIQRLNEPPTRRAVLADITCDSDGKIDRFGHPAGTRRALELHALRPDEPYYLAVFLTGAYQETLGDLHNLFGDPHVAHIRLDDKGGWGLDEVVRGTRVRQVLTSFAYDVDRLYPRLARDCEAAVRLGRLTEEESRQLLRFFEAGLDGYTYLEAE